MTQVKNRSPSKFASGSYVDGVTPRYSIIHFGYIKGLIFGPINLLLIPKQKFYGKFIVATN